MKAIEKAGYRSSSEEELVDTDRDSKAEEIRSLWLRFLISLIATLPLCIFQWGI